MTRDEIIAKMREGLDIQIREAIESDEVPFAAVQQVTQSWLLFQILKRLDTLIQMSKMPDLTELKEQQ